MLTAEDRAALDKAYADRFPGQPIHRGERLIEPRRPEGNGTIAHLLIVLLAIFALILLIASLAPRAHASTVCDPQVHQRCAKVNSDGSLSFTTTGGTGTGLTQETAAATGTTAATTATLATSATKKTYICGFSVRSAATAAIAGVITITGVITGTLSFEHITKPIASDMGITEKTFTPCIPASAINTAIAVVSPAPGTGGVVSVEADGYQQ